MTDAFTTDLCSKPRPRFPPLTRELDRTLGAAASLREGLDATLAALRLGLSRLSPLL